MNQHEFESLVSAKDYIEHFTPVLNQYCEAFEAGETIDIGDFVTGLEGFAKVLEILLITNTHHSIQVDLPTIEEALREITNALAGGANSLVSDIIKANILTLLLEWEKEIELVITTQEPDLLS